MATADLLQDDLDCSACGGHRTFAPDRQALVCSHCGDATAVESRIDKADDEICLSRADDRESLELGSLAFTCEACAGEIVFAGQALSTRCPYCDGPVVRHPGASGFVPAGIASFRVVEARAREAMARWFQSRRLLPNALQDRAADARLAGVYAPFWTFDATAIVDYVGQRGTKSGKNTRWTRVTGRIEVPFDDILMPASGHITADIRDATGPWPVKEVVDFEPRFLAGFAAELHRARASEAADATREDVQPILEQKVKAAIGGQRQKIDQLTTTLKGATCRSMLLPLWILHYDHRGQAYRVIASGISGRAFGERPFCPVKLKIASFAATVGAAALGAVIGLLHAAGAS